MAQCSFCDTQTSMPFTCKFCEKSFCSEHRLPENHDCGGLESYKEQSREKGKVGYDVPKNRNKTGDITVTSRSSNSFTDRITAALPIKSKKGVGRNLPITYIILGVMFVMFVLQMTFQGWFSDNLVLFPHQVFQKPWTLFTSMFLHANVTHLLVNAIVLFSFGTEIERILGDKKYLGLLFASGIISLIGVTLSGFLFNMSMPAVGISGGLFGLVAFLAVVRPGTKVLAFFIIPLKIRTAVVAFGAIDLVNFLTQLLAMPSLYAMVLGVNVASAGHLSGLAVGLLYGYLNKDKYMQQRPRGLSNMYTQFTRF